MMSRSKRQSSPPTLLAESTSGQKSADQLRSLRTVLMKNYDHVHTIQITSSTAGEGKTFLAVNLALSLSQIGQKTLLVDANFATPGIAQAFDVPEAPGLLEMLDGQSEVTPQFTKYSNLTVVSTSSTTKSVTDQLAQPQFLRLLSQWKQEYDRIVIDSSAVIAHPDAQLIATLTDATILTLKLKKTKKHEMHQALNLLEETQVNVLGWVAFKP